MTWARENWMRLLSAATGGVLLLSPMIALGQPSNPAVGVVRNFYGKVETIMRSGQDIQGRFAQLRPAMLAAFNTPAMIKTALGTKWDELSPEAKKRLEAAYSDFVVALYANKIDGYSGEKFEVEPGSVGQRRGQMIFTKIFDSKGRVHSVNYIVGPDLKISDTIFDGTISELASRRAEFTSIIDRSGPDELVRSLSGRVDKLLQR